MNNLTKPEKIAWLLGHQLDAPVERELLWTEARDDGLRIVRNIPFFAKGVSWGDVVRVSGVTDDGFPVAEGIAEHSGFSTYRMWPEPTHPEGEKGVRYLADFFVKLGCGIETGRSELIVAISAPLSVDIQVVEGMLQGCAEAGGIGFDIGFSWVNNR